MKAFSNPTRSEPPEPAAAEPGGAPEQPRRRRLPGGAWTWASALLAIVILAALVAYLVTPKPGAVIQGPTGSHNGISVEHRGPGTGLPKLSAGRSAPGFSLPRLGGGAPVSLASDRGHPVVLNFFASWCSDCRAELHAFATVSNAPSGSVRFVGVDTNDHNQKGAQALLRAAGDRYPVAVDTNGGVASEKYLVEALPVTVFIGASGHIVGQAFGTQSVQSLDKWVRVLKGHSTKKGGS